MFPEAGVTLAVCLCACLLAALAYVAYRVRHQAMKIRRLASERLRLETELELLARELQESNRVLEQAQRQVDELLAASRVEESTAADAIDAIEVDTEENDAVAPETSSETPGSPPEFPIWSDIDTAAVGRLCNLRSSGRSDLYGRLVELFESGSARALVELRTALERGRFEDAATVSHKFASSAANVGALTFAQRVRELERLCETRDAGHAWGMYLRLRAAHPALMVILQARRLKASA